MAQDCNCGVELVEEALAALVLTREQQDNQAREIARLREALTDLCDAIPDQTVTDDHVLGVWLQMARDALTGGDGCFEAKTRQDLLHKIPSALREELAVHRSNCDYWKGRADVFLVETITLRAERDEARHQASKLSTAKAEVIADLEKQLADALQREQAGSERHAEVTLALRLAEARLAEKDETIRQQAHELKLIADRVGERGVTDCSTPLFIRVENIVARLSDAEAIIAKMREALEWQPIETAPLNGTRVLVFWDYWSHDAFMAYFKHGRWNGEVALSEGDTDGPTHWMPLPSVAALSTPRQP